MSNLTERPVETPQASTPSPWQMREVLTLSGEYYTISRIVDRRRVHLEYASNGKPMLYGSITDAAASLKAMVAHHPGLNKHEIRALLIGIDALAHGKP